MATSKKFVVDLSQGFDELESIVAWFENGETDLEEGVKKFERAMILADALKQRLSRAENTVQEIKKKYQHE